MGYAVVPSKSREDRAKGWAQTVSSTVLHRVLLSPGWTTTLQHSFWDISSSSPLLLSPAAACSPWPEALLQLPGSTPPLARWSLVQIHEIFPWIPLGGWPKLHTFWGMTWVIFLEIMHLAELTTSFQGIKETQMLSKSSALASSWTAAPVSPV